MGYRLSHHLTTCTVQEHRSWVVQPHKQNDDKHSHPHIHIHHTHTHTCTHARTHTLTHAHTHTTYAHTQSQRLTLLIPPPLSRSKCGLHLEVKLGCSISDTRRGLKCPVPHPRGKGHVLISGCACLHPQIYLLPAHC